MISTLVIARMEPLVILGWMCNTCGEYTCGEYTKDKMFASWALTSFDKPRTVVAAGANPGGLTSLVCP